MRVRCPQCRSEYAYDEARFGSAERKRLKCPKCGTVFEVRNPILDKLDATDIDPARSHPANRTTRQTTARILVEPEAPELPRLAPLPRDQRFALAVISGEQAGAVFKIVKPRTFIGRGANMDVRITDSEVSRRHAMLEIRGDEALLVDLGSTNGTYVDGERVEHAVLNHQAEFTIGGTTLIYLVTPLKH